MSESRGRTKSRLPVILLLVFTFALFMGPGPGIYLVNPVPGEPGTRRVVLGMPIVYVWAVSWFFVQLAVVLIAYVKLWSREGHRDDAQPTAQGE